MQKQNSNEMSASSCVQYYVWIVLILMIIFIFPLGNVYFLINMSYLIKQNYLIVAFHLRETTIIQKHNKRKKNTKKTNNNKNKKKQKPATTAPHWAFIIPQFWVVFWKLWRQKILFFSFLCLFLMTAVNYVWYSMTIIRSYYSEY